MSLYSLETAADFIKVIPRTVEDNVNFRLGLHKKLAVDKSFQKVFWSWCRDDL